MRDKVWEVKLGSMSNPETHNTVMNITAPTLTKAVGKAAKLERELCKEMETDDGNKVTADRPIAVRFLCKLDE